MRRTDMKKRIEIQTENPSKADEIKVLEKLEGIFKGTDTYLASLFNCHLSGWVEKRIKNDFPPDIFEAYRHREEELQKKADDANKAASIFQGEAHAAKRILEEEQKTVKSLSEDLRISEDLRERETDKVALAHELHEDAVVGLEELNRQLEEKDQEIVKLKAALYDAMTS
jgi:hypothetical protein